MKNVFERITAKITRKKRLMAAVKELEEKYLFEPANKEIEEFLWTLCYTYGFSKYFIEEYYGDSGETLDIQPEHLLSACENKNVGFTV